MGLKTDKPNCEDHPETVEKYDGNLKELAEDIGDLRYDKLAEFLNQLEIKIYDDAYNDFNGKRLKLSGFLLDASILISDLKNKIREAWHICKPYMK